MPEDFVENACANGGKSRRGLEEPCDECGWRPDSIEKRTTFRRYRPPQIPDWRIPIWVFFIDALFKLPLLTILGLLLGLSAFFWTLSLLLFFEHSGNGVVPSAGAGMLQLFSGCCFAGAAGLIKTNTINRTLFAVAMITQSAAILLAAFGFQQFANR